MKENKLIKRKQSNQLPININKNNIKIKNIKINIKCKINTKK